MNDFVLRRLIVAAALVSWMSTASPAALSRVRKGAGPDRVDLLEDRALPLTPKRARSEADRDRVAAAALFAQGRILFQRRDFNGALRSFQRAHRSDPEALSILREIVPLAFGLERHTEAVRYTVILAEKDPHDPVLLRRLARYLTSLGQLSRARWFYEKAIELEPGAKPDAERVLARLEMARLYFLTGRYKTSAESFAVVRDALEHPDRYGLNESQRKEILGKPAATYTLMAESSLEAERPDEALDLFEKANRADPNKGLLAFQTARVEAQRGHTDAAMKHLQEYLDAKLSSGGAEPYRLLAELLDKSSKTPQEARRRLETKLASLHADDPANAPLGYYLAQKCLEWESLDRAEQIYVSLTRTQPTIDGYDGLVEVYRRRGRIDKLLDVLGQAVLRTGTFQPLGEKTRAAVADAALARKLLDEAVRRHDKNPESMGTGVALAGALLALAQKRMDAADALFATAADTAAADQKAGMVLSWGIELLVAGQGGRAAAVLQRALDEKAVPKNNPGIYFYLAGAQEMAGQTEKALLAARKAAELSDEPRYKTRRGWILYHAGRYEQAREDYRRLIRTLDADRDNPEVRDVLRDARMSLSNVCIRMEQVADAEEWLQQVLDEFPEDVGAMNDLGYLWADQGKHLHRSLDMITRAVDNEPENAAYRDSLGWVLYRLGRCEEAIKELERAAAKEQAGEILDHLADAYLKANRRDEAIRTWRKAAAAYEKEKEIEKAKATLKKIDEHKSK